jgi:succinate dehydrogenase / fumarate reductase cytochrome b subunit
MAARLLDSTIGKKAVMAVTGIILVGFVVGHMVGNLQLFLPAHGGEPALDEYGRFLRSFLHGGGLWVARAVLLGSVIAHIWAAVTLTQRNGAARPVAYRNLGHSASTLSSRTMIVSGLVVFLFIVYHLLHFTLGSVHPAFHEGKVFHNVVTGFQVPWVSAFYILAMLALAPHLRHGIWSLFQTLGLSHPRYDRLRPQLALAITLLVVAANISFPVAVLAGVVR